MTPTFVLPLNAITKVARENTEISYLEDFQILLVNTCIVLYNANTTKFAERSLQQWMTQPQILQ